jgi:phthiocerol/phenolphthiocerol synthesis type-I polyketide synthase C
VSYVFTDIGGTFLDRAAPRFEGCGTIEFRILDISRDPAGQAFEAASFDIVIAANVLHATPDLRASLEHVADLLRPGGLLLAVETQPQRYLDILFGSLPGWWLHVGDPWRPEHPLLEAAAWRERLAECGFRDVRTLGDAPCGILPNNLVILANHPGARAPAVEEPVAPPARPVLIVADPAEPLAGMLIAALTRAGASADIAPVATPAIRDRFPRGEPAPKLVFAWRGPEDDDDRLVMRLEAIRSVLGELDAVSADSVELTLVTVGAVAATEPDDAGIRAAGRVIANEYSRVTVRLMDMDAPTDANIALLADEILSSDDVESQPTFQRGLRHVPRLMPAIAVAARDETRFTLEIGRLGALDSLYAAETEPPLLPPDHVEVEVRAVGLNFHDLMWSNGMLPEEAVETGFVGSTLGMEFSGIVTRAGTAVSGYAAGDRVMGMGRASMASHVVAPSGLLGQMPGHISFEEAATIPGAMLTAVYALEHVGQMQPGETLLVHAAAGGVGLAAINLARVLGLETIATAGSTEKREMLRRLGVRHVFDSRSNSSHADVLRATDGQGVDAVLNSLAGEAIPRSLSLLKPFGRFLELGKRDFYANSRIGLRPFRDNVSFFGIDIDQLMVQKPTVTFMLYRRVMDLVTKRLMSPLPYRVFPVGRVVEAFRLMQQARHVGKIVIAMQEDRLPVRAARRRLNLDPTGSYLVTGGTGGFGLATAVWLAERGARHLVLASRRGLFDAAAFAAIAELRQKGVDVTVERADVADPVSIGAVFARLAETGRRLDGVVHAAMVLDDAAVSNMSPDRWAAALRPKVQGAVNLDRLTRGMPDLSLFVLFSSATTHFGNPGQANYVAANAYLEALARRRRSAGLAGLAVAWGAIGEVGFVARHGSLGDTLESAFGLRLVPPGPALDALEQAVLDRRVDVLVADVDWARLVRGIRIGRWPVFAGLVGASATAQEQPGVDADLRQILTTLPPSDAAPLLQSRIASEIGSVLRLAADKIPLDRTLSNMGMDSLMLVELQTALDSGLGLNLSSMRMSGLTVAGLVAMAVDTLRQDGHRHVRAVTD